MPFPGHFFENVILKKSLKKDHFCPLNGFYSKSPHLNWLKVIFPYTGKNHLSDGVCANLWVLNSEFCPCTCWIGCKKSPHSISSHLASFSSCESLLLSEINLTFWAFFPYELILKILKNSFFKFSVFIKNILLWYLI